MARHLRVTYGGRLEIQGKTATESRTLATFDDAFQRLGTFVSAVSGAVGWTHGRKDPVAVQVRTMIR
jgi:hypothetical protein